MLQRPSTAKFATISAMMLALCWFCLVIAYGWARHGLPAGGKGLAACLAGMAVVGSFVGFAVTALMSIVLRRLPAKFRWPLSSAAWLVVCTAAYLWLIHSGGDSARSGTLAAIAGVFGVFIGAPNARLFVTAWLVKRTQKAADAERDRTLAEAKEHTARAQAELKRRFAAEQLARLNEQERAHAIRNFMRS